MQKRFLKFLSDIIEADQTGRGLFVHFGDESTININAIVGEAMELWTEIMSTEVPPTDTDLLYDWLNALGDERFTHPMAETIARNNLFSVGPALRGAAARALMTVLDKQSVPLLIEALAEERNPHVRATIKSCLRVFE